MKAYEATEQAYKNGYEKGYRDGQGTAVKHGRWRRRGNETKCSVCEFIYYSTRADFNYCPNCGAKMDLK